MNNEKKVIAPLSGKVIALSEVPDEVFSAKILGDGALTKKLTVQANKFTASAKEKIEAAGGKVEVF